MRITETADGVELYFPPLRMPEVALPLAAFGVAGAAIPALMIYSLAPSALGHAGTLLAATLVAGFALPFLVFGALFVLLALYMLANAFLVRSGPDGIETARVLFGVVVKRRRIARHEIATIDAEIASRFQSVFSSHPVYQLVARASDRRRVLVGETLRGEVEMERVKALLENSPIHRKDEWNVG